MLANFLCSTGTSKSARLFQMADEAADEVSDAGGMVKIISAENHTFVDRETGTIKAMLSGQFAESRGECRFPEITSSILEVCDQLSRDYRAPACDLGLHVTHAINTPISPHPSTCRSGHIACHK